MTIEYWVFIGTIDEVTYRPSQPIGNQGPQNLAGRRLLPDWNEPLEECKSKSWWQIVHPNKSSFESVSTYVYVIFSDERDAMFYKLKVGGGSVIPVKKTNLHDMKHKIDFKFDPEKHSALLNFCLTNFEDDCWEYFYNPKDNKITFSFRHKQDAMRFKLKWQ